MDDSQIEPEEMERRHNKDFIASLKMIGEGRPRLWTKRRRPGRRSENRKRIAT